METLKNKERLAGYMKGLRVSNSHAHHMTDEKINELGISSVLRQSYVGWCAMDIPKNAGEVSAFVAAVGARGFFLRLQRSLMELYSMHEPVSERTWEAYDERIKDAHADPDWHMQILREKCCYDNVVQDSYWSPGSGNGHGLFRPIFRINSFLYGYNKNAADHNGNNAQHLYGSGLNEIKDIDEYIAFVKKIIKMKKDEGCVGIKSAIAYDRHINIEPSRKANANAAFKDGAAQEDIVHFQDYIFDQICCIAAELDMPFQIHTGLGNMVRTRAMELQPLIDRHRNTNFVLMHGGYPWTDDIVALALYHNNVAVDLCWLPLLSFQTACRLVNELIEVCNADRVVWGCDTWTSEESYGALLAVYEVLAHVLAEKIERNEMDIETAERYTEGVLHGNAKKIFKL